MRSSIKEKLYVAGGALSGIAAFIGFVCIFSPLGPTLGLLLFIGAGLIATVAMGKASRVREERKQTERLTNPILSDYVRLPFVDSTTLCLNNFVQASALDQTPKATVKPKQSGPNKLACIWSGVKTSLAGKFRQKHNDEINIEPVESVPSVQPGN